LRDGLAQIFQNLDFSAVFKETDPPKKIVNPQTYLWFSQEFEVTDPPKNLANLQISLDRKPGNREV
jgi:hypothetical protein